MFPANMGAGSISFRQDPGGRLPLHLLFRTRGDSFPPGSWRFNVMEAMTNELVNAGVWIGRQQAFALIGSMCSQTSLPAQSPGNGKRYCTVGGIAS